MPDPKHPFGNNIPDMQLPERDSAPPAHPTPPTTPPANDANSISATPAPTEKEWRKGDRVLAPWEPMFLYAGKITQFAGGQLLIEFDDGDSCWVPLAQVQPLAFKRGQRLQSRIKMGPTFGPAEIVEIDDENVRVRFDDGKIESTTVAALRVPCEPMGRGAEGVAVNPPVISGSVGNVQQGDRVWALWQGQALFVSTVTKMREGEGHVRFDDGDQAWVRLEHMTPFAVHVGMFVMGRWKMGGGFYPGKITQVQGDRIHIKYDDGDQEWTTSAALALPVQAAPGASAGPPPPPPPSQIGRVRRPVAPPVAPSTPPSEGSGISSRFIIIGMGMVIIALLIIVGYLASN